MTMRRLGVVSIVLSCVRLAAQQQPSPAAGSVQTLPAAPEAYRYNPEGRRDPFVSLLSAGVDSRPTGTRSEGLSGLSANEVSVRGIMQSRGGYVAMVQAPDSHTYLVHTNDRLLDGRVTAITPLELIITQDVNDPLSMVKQREVRKPLRPLEEDK